MKVKRIYMLLLALAAVISSCAVSLNGASIPAEMKSVTVNFFENNAPLVNPFLSQQFTEAFRTRIRNQSRLSIVQNDGNGIFEGRITGYDIRPVTLTDNRTQSTQGTSRLTITIAVKYTNNINPKQSFEESFARFANFTVTGTSFQAREPQLVKEITDQLTEDIFNRAFAQW
jgi:hypothetical protein